MPYIGRKPESEVCVAAGLVTLFWSFWKTVCET